MRKHFEFTAGSLALDFVDTLAGRAGEPVELLQAPESLKSWIKEAGFDVADPFPVSGADIAKARMLREVIHRVVTCLVEEDFPSKPDIACLNATAAHPPLQPVFEDGAVQYRADEPGRALLATVAADAILCLAADRVGSLRRCPDCRMLFLDRSRRGNRKWCSSASGCGNRAKVRRHRANHRGAKRDMETDA